MRTTIFLTAVATLALGTGCMYEVADFPSQEELYDRAEPRFADEHRSYPGFVLATPRGEAFVARISDKGILGHDMHLWRRINVGRYMDADDRAIRGEAFGQWLDLKVNGDRVHGVFDGTSPLDLTATREGQTLRVRGLVRGTPSDFRVDEKQLAGVIGRCGYNLRGVGGHIFEGVVNCRGMDSLIMVKIPAELTRWTDAELGAALGMLLGGR
jgi:hypothetical protein